MAAPSSTPPGPLSRRITEVGKSPDCCGVEPVRVREHPEPLTIPLITLLKLSEITPTVTPEPSTAKVVRAWAARMETSA
jgi:hypothetical protein